MSLLNRKFQIIAIVLPLLVMAAWVGSYSIDRKTAREFTFPITGFDPRDLLSGHYLQYAVDYSKALRCNYNAPSWCVCIEDTRPFASVTQEGQCGDLSCKVVLQGRCEGARFIAGIERFYFPEKYKNLAAVVPPKSSITIALSSSGRAVVKSMQVGDLDLLDWLKLQAKE